MKQIYKDSLQAKAINLDMGPAMILAGPGSGKTFVITHRIQNLILDHKIRPSEILVITFTKAAANEMKSRFQRLNPRASDYVSFGTFHSIFYYFLRNFSNKDPKIISTDTKNDILKNLVETFNFVELFEDIDSLSFDISKYKNNIYKFDSTMSYSDEEKKSFLEIFNRYEETVSNLNYIDYDDILLRFYRLLNENREIAGLIRAKYKALLIDEFQDINEIQYEIVKMILPDNRNIFVVGDDDQSIYGFRGAKPSIMKTFLEDYRDSKLVSLSHNYRSFQMIIDMAERLIKNNTFRMKDTGQISGLENDIKAKESPFELLVFSSKEEQDAFICNFVSEEKFENLGILTRTNKDCSYYKKIIVNKKESSKDSDYIMNEIFSDIYNYIKFCLTDEKEYLFEVLNKPQRYLPKSIILTNPVSLDACAHKNLGSLYGSNLQILSRHIKVLKKSTPLPFVKYLLDFVGYKKYLYDSFPDQRQRIDFGCESIINMAKEKKSLYDFCMEIERHLAYMNKDFSEDENLKNIAITTYHSSKGLEFDCVLLPDVCEGNVPGRISLKNDNLEEERRLFYVAMTRAKKKLLILTIKNEESTSMLPSRFVTELSD